MTSPGLDAIALVHAQLDDAAADFGSDVHFGRLDVAGDAQSIAGVARRRARHQTGAAQRARADERQS